MRAAWLRRWLGGLVAAWVGSCALSCAQASGLVHADGGPAGAWSLRPNRCKVGDPSPAWAGGVGVIALAPNTADLYYAGTNPADTEVVVGGDGLTKTILVRVPGQGKMVPLHDADCTVLDISTGNTSYTVNDEAGLSGSARFDCRRPEVGHVVGDVSFTCF